MHRRSKNRNIEDYYYVMEETYDPGSFKEQIKEIFSWKYLAFLLRPGYKDRELENREYELNKFKSKRSFIRRLKPVPTIMGIILLFVITTLAVFADWIVFDLWRDLAFFP